MAQKRYVVSISPHVRNCRSIRSLIGATIAALVPATAWGVYQFGVPAVLLIAAGIGGAVATEGLVTQVARKPLTIRDGHAVLVGLLIALMLPAGTPWWIALIGAAAGILVGKMPFGPLGGHPLSPAIVGLLVVTMSWPAEVASYQAPRTAAAELHAADAAPAEDPQTAVRVDPSDAAEYCTTDLFLGKQAGAIGAISPLLLLVGGLFLIWRRAARWQGPVGFLLGLGVAATVAHAASPFGIPSPTFQLLTGLAFFGAFFLCTEWTSTPVTPWGLFLFAFFAGGLAILFRLTGMEFGAVPWAIVIMSLATPRFDRIAPVPFGKVVHHA
jgi:electron transport complex protein RnfD